MKALAWEPGGEAYGLGLAAGWPHGVVQVTFPFHAGFSKPAQCQKMQVYKSRCSRSGPLPCPDTKQGK